MKLWIETTGEGISLRFGEGELRRLEPSPSASQSNPRGFYVYAHFDERSTPFYIGKGTGRRAWDDSRHPLWHRYVDRHLGGKFTVRILIDELTADRAEECESQWITQESETLVNWINFGRKTDFDAVERFHALRNANLELIAAARHLEKSDPERAVAAYYQGISNIAAYATLQTEGGLIGLLLNEERQECGYSGELAALDRLTLCLARLGRGVEAQTATHHYFARYKADLNLSAAEAINRRVAKAARRGS